MGSGAALGNLGQGLAVLRQRACWDGSRAEYLFGGIAPVRHHLRSSVIPPAVGRCALLLHLKKEHPHRTQLPPNCRHSRHPAIVDAGSSAAINSSVFFTPFEDRVERLLIVDIPLVLVSSSRYGLQKLIPRNFRRQPKIPPQISLDRQQFFRVFYAHTGHC